MLAVRKFPELFEVVGYAEENERWVEKRGNMKGYEGLPRMGVDELISKCDAMLIETDVWDLTATAKKCIDAGLHIHMDKPASGTLEEYKALLDSAEQQKLVVQLGYMYRYNPAILKCLEHIKNGDLGEIYSINAEMSTYHTVPYKQWLCNFKGGIQYILGSHLVDLIVYILGEPNNITAWEKHTKLDGVDFADNNLAVLEYDKALARVFVSSVEVNGWGRRSFMVSGSKGTVDIEPIENDCTMTYASTDFCSNCYEDMHQDVEVKDIPKNCRYDDMMQDFHAYIMGTKENPFTYEHDYKVHKVIDKMVGGVGFYGHNID